MFNGKAKMSGKKQEHQEKPQDTHEEQKEAAKDRLTEGSEAHGTE